MPQQRGQFTFADIEQGEQAQGQFSMEDVETGGGVLDVIKQAAHIPGITEAPEFIRAAARRLADAVTEPVLPENDPDVPLPFGITAKGSTIRGFAGGAAEGAAEFANLLDLLSFGRGGTAKRAGSGLLALRGVGNVAEGVEGGSLAQGARGVAETALGALGMRAPAPAPRPHVEVSTPPRVTVGPVPAAGVPPRPALPPPALPPARPPVALLNAARPPLVTPPPPDPSFVRAVPGEYPQVSAEKVIEILRNATRPAAEAGPAAAGFAEPPIVPRPATAPPPIPNIVEPISGTGMASPAAEVVELLKARQAGAAPPVAARPARTADVILDERLTGGGKSFDELSTEIGQLERSITARDVSDSVWATGVAKLKELRAEQAARFPDELKARATRLDASAKQAGGDALAGRTRAAETEIPQSVQDADTLRGRSTLAGKLPKGADPTVAHMDTLDALGNAYRKAAAKHDAAKLDYTAGKISADDLQAANITKRQAGKSLREMERTIIKEAEAAAARVNKEAGFIAPQLLQALSGGTIGGLTGASLDEDDPVRGALIGAAAGALAPGVVIGTAKSVKTEGLRAVGKLYISGLLSGPMTMVRNVTSTAANGLFRAAFHPAAVLIDHARTSPGARNVTLNDITPAAIATWTGFKRGASDAIRAFVTGQSPYAGLFSGAPPIPNELAGGLGNAANWPGRALDALDTWMGRIVESQTIASRAWVEATNRGVPVAQRWRMVGNMQANPSAAIQMAADNEAKRVLFRGDPGKLTEKISELRKVLNEITPGKVPIGDWLIPFVRVPAMIARQATELTPAGLLQDTSLMDPRTKTEHYARVFVGSLVMLKGAELAIEGRVSGSGPSNPQERSKLYETGWRPYSINVPLKGPIAAALGGTKAEDGTFWIPTNALGPAGMMLGAVGDMAEGWREGSARDNATMESKVLETAGRLAHAATDQTFLSDVVDLGEALDNPGMLNRYFQRKMGSAVPAVARQATRALDPVVRDPKSSLEAIKANIPGLSTTVPARTDRFGEEIKRARGTEFIPRNPAAEVLDNAGAALNKSQGRISVTEPDLRRALEGAGFVFGEDNTITLTPAEKRTLTNKRGQEVAKVIAGLKHSDTYKALPPAAQKIVIERIKRRIESDRRMPELLELLKARKGTKP